MTPKTPVGAKAPSAFDTPMRSERLALVLAMQIAIWITAVSQQPDEIQQQLGNVDTQGLSPSFDPSQ